MKFIKQSSYLILCFFIADFITTEVYAQTSQYEICEAQCNQMKEKNNLLVPEIECISNCMSRADREKALLKREEKPRVGSLEKL